MPDKTKISKSGSVELTEKELSTEELDQVAAGRASKSKDPAYFTVKIDPERLQSSSSIAIKK